MMPRFLTNHAFQCVENLGHPKIQTNYGLQSAVKHKDFLIIINFKNYLEGKKALSLAKKIENYLPDAIIAVPATDIKMLAEKTKLKVFAQHIDCLAIPERSTGFLSAKTISSAGAEGSLLNHSEHQLSFSQINCSLKELKHNKLKAVLCVPTLAEARKLKKLKPYAMAFEDIKLIATNKSITSYRTKEIKEFISLLKNSNILPLCGAGIHTAEDVRAAFNLGCKGVLIASAIAKSKNPEILLQKLSKIKDNPKN
ncbi:MAG: triose-phosphate isomerase [Nanoarchaeota archaeon]